MKMLIVDDESHIRELENVLERAMIACEGEDISVADLGPAAPGFSLGSSWFVPRRGARSWVRSVVGWLSILPAQFFTSPPVSFSGMRFLVCGVCWA